MSGQVVRFDQFEVDLRSRELRKGGLRVRLQDQPFQILTMLLDRAGDVVTREEIREMLAGHLCRCTGYHFIVEAIEAAAQALAPPPPRTP